MTRFATIILAAILFSATALAAAASTLSSSEEFFRDEGAHFENNYEHWEISGTVTDRDGESYLFSALFYETGGVYMNMRSGFVTFRPMGATDTVWVSLGPAAFMTAAKGELQKKLNEDPSRDDIKAAIERIENKDTPNFEFFETTADVFRTFLYIEYGRNHFERHSRDRFEYYLSLNVKGNKLSLLLESPEDPVRFEDSTLVLAGKGGSLKGYSFPRLKVSGSLITTGKKTTLVTGSARFTHLWGEPQRGVLARYTLFSLGLDDGRSLNSFNFFNTDGSPASSFTAIAGIDGKDISTSPMEITETQHWTSPASNMKYPFKWKVKAPSFEGEISMLDSFSEMSVLEGIGAFYFGPCDFLGKSQDGKPVTGLGSCRMAGTPEPSGK